MWSRNSLRNYTLTLLCILYSANATFRQAKYYKAQGSLALTQESLYSEKARGPKDCSARCQVRNCSCFYFDKLLQQCNTGNCIPFNSATVTSNEFHLSCDYSDGFKSITYGSITACVWVSTTHLNYADARDDCKARASHLYTLKAVDKLKLLQANYVKASYWIGLDDLVSEGVFKWVDDNTVYDANLKEKIFAPNQPDNSQNLQDCVNYRVVDTMLDDNNCAATNQYICEKPFFNIY